MAFALTFILFGLYLALGMTVQQYTRRVRLIVLGVSALVPAGLYFMLT
jgi:hypothetical protein